MHVYFSTVIRYADPEHSGHMVKLDWESKRILAQQPVAMTPPFFDDPNPRGNSRGGRGIERVGDQIVLAQYHTLRIFDEDLNLKRDLTHPLMAGLHEVTPDPNDPNRLWVAATALDAALQFDLNSGELIGQYWPREMPGIAKTLGVEPLEIDKDVDNRTNFLEHHVFQDPSHLHVNAVTPLNGRLYALCNKHGAVVELTEDRVVFQTQQIQHGHNLVPDDEQRTFFVNDSRNGHVRRFDVGNGTHCEAVNLTTFAPVARLVRGEMVRFKIKRLMTNLKLAKFPSVMPLFIRGLDRVGDQLFVGISPATILRIDWPKGELIDLFTFSDDVSVAVHGLRAIPSGNA